jgi:predicted transcriptional regulator
MKLRDPELAILLLLKKDEKLRWEDLVEKSSYSRRWVHKKIQGLMEKGLIKREQDKDSKEYPSPVYYSIIDLPQEVEAQLKLFEAAKQILEPLAEYQRTIEAISAGLNASMRSVQEFAQAYENATKKIDETTHAVGELMEQMKPLIDDLEKAVKSGEIPSETLKAPVDEAVRIFLTYKVEKGELPHEILKLPLREAIQKYRNKSWQKRTQSDAQS